jgi:hypothetical protein
VTLAMLNRRLFAGALQSFADTNATGGALRGGWLRDTTLFVAGSLSSAIVPLGYHVKNLFDHQSL